MKGLNILTFDIEDWYNHDDYSLDLEWDKFEVRLYEGVDLILSALCERGIKATFFCLGWVAEKHPTIVEKIVSFGHHLGCHSYQHQLATSFTPKQFYEDTFKAKCLLEDVGGVAVDAYRVPSFSITRDNKWALDIIAKLGVKYDCSVFPSVHEFGGMPNFPSVPTVIQTEFGQLKEFPINLGALLGRDIVYTGGGYFRVMPYSILKKMVENTDYVMSYFHPSDFDPDQPHMHHLPLMRQFKNRIALRGAYAKFKRFIDDFEFVDLHRADELYCWNNCQIIDIKTI